MANVGTGTARQIIDSDGDVVGVTDNRLDVNATIGLGSSTLTTYAEFDVDTTAIQLSSANGIGAVATTCKEIIIQSQADNTGYVMIGDDDVVADSEGIRINAGDTLILPVSVTTNVWLRGSVNNQMINVSIIF